ncbi:alpha,alpha-trehalase nth1 [Saxophila tyrrhenica]|uniref:Trehalase n=1 Tax=Saxophila tyrrhenica TaxID=1690608 RepID=A0AAV9P9P9_9PEZI|nr:alpha,alpha-trehalase nth1 [Saxophila tyrrhenica]
MSVQRSPTSPRATTKQSKPRKVSVEFDPFAAPDKYYSTSYGGRKVGKSRTYSEHDPALSRVEAYRHPGRRGSQDVPGGAPRRYLLDVDETLDNLRKHEDTDHNDQITIEDRGPKSFSLPTVSSEGYRRFDIRGTYMLSNLLQELSLAQKYGRKQIELDEVRLNENPVNRLSRRIKDLFWANLTRRIDGRNVFQVASDPKDWTKEPRPRIYIPRGAPEQYHYYKRIAEEHPKERLEVMWLAEEPGDDDYVRDLNEAPGLLAIEMERVADTPEGKPDYRGLPFVVPGGRFNELYGWDSYMETLGLLVNGKPELGESMVRHFCFCIRHYGKILNANRTYYLCRSQPPFLSDMALRVYEHIKEDRARSTEFLRTAMLAAIKDYYKTWMSKPRYDPVSGLSRYVPGGRGIPPETESTHFYPVLRKYTEKHGMTFQEFIEAYNYGRVFEPELDQYLLHDRSVRESGHDTSYRLEKVSAHLATVDLNSLLYKIESDICRTIRFFFGDRLEIPPEWQVPGKPTIETSAVWERRAAKRRKTMNELMWDEDTGMFFDYNTVKREQTGYESATTFWAMWAGAATPAQALTMVQKALPLFEVHGGLVSGTFRSRGRIDKDRPSRQWDYPYGWAPQQILAWTGLLRYGFKEDAQRLAYRWIYMCTKAFVDFNGVVVEKYDVTKKTNSHVVDAEYGNQGADFKGVATEGFGWVNASYVYGLQIVTEHMKRALGAVTEWDDFKRMTEASSAKEAAQILEHAHMNDKGAGQVHVAEHVHLAAAGVSSPKLPHNHQDESGHKATHGAAERKEHHGPGEVKSGGVH